jgi:hypothetical protein
MEFIEGGRSTNRLKNEYNSLYNKNIFTEDEFDSFKKDVDNYQQGILRDINNVISELARKWALRNNLDKVEQLRNEINEKILDDFQSLDYWIVLGLLRSGEKEKALELLPQLVPAESLSIYILLGMTDMRNKTMIRLKRDDADESTTIMAIGLLIAGKLAEAEEFIGRSPIDHCDIGGIYSKAALILLEQGNLRQAESLVEKIFRDTEWIENEGEELVNWIFSLEWPFHVAFHITKGAAMIL